MTRHARGGLNLQSPLRWSAALALVEPRPDVRLGRANRLSQVHLTAGGFDGSCERFMVRAHTTGMYRYYGKVNRIYGRDGRLCHR